MQELMFTCADLTQSISYEVRVDAALVVASLVLFEMDTPNELSDEVVLTTATRLLGDEEEEVVAAGCRIFINLTVSNEGCLLLANKHEAMTTLANMLTSQPLSKLPTRIVELLVEVLANLTRVYEGARTCAQFPVIAPVLSLVKKPRLCRADTLMHTAMVITNVAAYDQAKREAIQHDAVELCLKALSKVLLGQVRCEPAAKGDELTRCLVAAVMALSTSEDAKPRVIEFGIEPLAQCLTHSSASVRQNASITINSACDLPRGVAPFTQRLLHSPDLLVDVLGIKAVSALDKNVSSFDDEDTPAAVKALAAIQKKDAYGTADRIVQTLDMLSNLVRALLESDVPVETQHSVAEVLRRMSETDASYRRRVGKCMAKYGVPEALFQQIVGLTPAEFQVQVANAGHDAGGGAGAVPRQPSNAEAASASGRVRAVHDGVSATTLRSEEVRASVRIRSLAFSDGGFAFAAASASFHIFILEQSLDGRKFNRGKLLNAGFDMARNDYDVYIFHDVDLLPGSCRAGTIRDLEELNLEDKLTLLRTSKWKCTVKHDLLKEHHRTWKKNGLKSLRYEYVDAEAMNESCTKITVKLGPNGHWSDSRSSLEQPTTPDQIPAPLMVLTVPETSVEENASPPDASPDKLQ
ncbi:unnamed protein product [Phytophthora lilii]|uniref:Unnamed protein product n=1 Tax=Phytophthora lilii TaxID=2077276 RepID=A0A9W6WPZ8_9STRA|nr:unnamed protein product [Phytophthora lilii]